MKSSIRRLLPSFYLLVSVILSGCAAQSSVIVLLPENGKVSGEVTVVNPNGSQVLSQSWQSVEIAGSHGQPEAPIVMKQSTVQDVFGGVLAALPLAPVHYLLYFKLDSAELLPDLQLLLPAIVAAISKRNPAQLSVVGHTDTVGSTEYNYRLGLLRAHAVTEMLASHGAAPISIEISSRGETDLLVKTPDQTLEPRNRRAEITIR